MSYADAVGGALERLRRVGYEHGPSFVNHAPMAAEALATMGYADLVPSWLESNLRQRRYHPVPEPRWPISPGDEADWSSALGDFARVADWTAMFERELAIRPWAEVLARWWPRLLPGMSGMLAHGVIRTAHAVRALALVDIEDRLQRRELAHGLGYWAARYAGRYRRVEPGPDWDDNLAGVAAGDLRTRVLSSLDEMIADNAGVYAELRPSFPIPLIHAVTAPAAVRLVCTYLPEGQLRPSYAAARRCSDGMWSSFAGSRTAVASGPGDTVRRDGPVDAAGADQLVAAAVELGDEHAIKLAEVAVRQHALAPDGRYFAASRVSTARMGRRSG